MFEMKGQIMKGQIAVVGSINMDMVVRTPRMPLPGETVKGYDFHVIPGGKGANQAVAAARLGADVMMIGRVGDDDFGHRQQHCLKQDSIDLSFLTVDPKYATGIAVITLDESGQNSIIISPEANGAVSAEQIDAAQTAIQRADMLLCQLEIPMEAVSRAIDIAHEHGVPVVLNPAPAARLEPSLLKKVTYLIPNETEASLLTGIEINNIDSAKKAAGQLQELGIAAVLVTLGENGVVLAQNGEYRHEPAISVKAVDTTAAGDVFVGGFAVALKEGKSVLEAVQFATHAAALSVTKLGAQSSIPTCSEVEQFLEKSH